MLWVKLAGALLAFSGVVFASLVLAMGLPVLPSLIGVVALVVVILFFMSREVTAPDMVMRESLWNTPEDDDEIDG